MSKDPFELVEERHAREDREDRAAFLNQRLEMQARHLCNVYGSTDGTLLGIEDEEARAECETRIEAESETLRDRAELQESVIAKRLTRERERNSGRESGPTQTESRHRQRALVESLSPNTVFQKYNRKR